MAVWYFLCNLYHRDIVMGPSFFTNEEVIGKCSDTTRAFRSICFLNIFLPFQGKPVHKDIQQITFAKKVKTLCNSITKLVSNASNIRQTMVRLLKTLLLLEIRVCQSIIVPNSANQQNYSFMIFKTVGITQHSDNVVDTNLPYIASVHSAVNKLKCLYYSGAWLKVIVCLLAPDYLCP